MLFVSYVWLLCCNVVGVWVVVIFVLSVMRVVGGVPLWVECVFRRVDVVCLCTVAILGAVFCVICSLLMFVFDASGDETYSSMGLVITLYVAMIVSFCFPHIVDVLLSFVVACVLVLKCCECVYCM